MQETHCGAISKQMDEKCLLWGSGGGTSNRQVKVDLGQEVGGEGGAGMLE